MYQCIVKQTATRTTTPHTTHDQPPSQNRIKATGSW
jgi:hypothetical protein